jgi:hypothetical protein
MVAKGVRGYISGIDGKVFKLDVIYLVKNPILNLFF